MARSVRVELMLDSSGAVQGIRNLQGPASSLDDQFDQARQSAQSFGNTAQIAFGNLAAEAIQGLLSRTGDLVREYAALGRRGVEINEIQNQFNVVFGDSQEIVNDTIQEFAALNGISEATAQQFAALSGSVVENFTESQEQTAQLSAEVFRLASDLTSFRNIPFERAIKAINGALAGQNDRLLELGIQVRAADVQERALANSTAETADELSNQEIISSRLATVTERLGSAVGDAQRTSGEAASETRQLTARFQNLRDIAAEETIPVVERLTEILADELGDPAIEQEVRALFESVGEGVVGVVEVLPDLIAFVREYSDAISTSIRVLGVIVTAIAAYKAGVIAANVATRTAAAAQAAYTAAQTAFASATSASTVALRAFRFALSSTGIGAIAAVLGTAAGYMLAFGDNTEDAADKTGDAADEVQRLTENLTELSDQQLAQRAFDLEDQIESIDEIVEGLREGEETLVEQGGSLAQISAVQQEINRRQQERNRLQQRLETIRERGEGSLRFEAALLRRQIQDIAAQGEETDELIRKRQRLAEIQRQLRSLESGDDAEGGDTVDNLAERERIRRELQIEQMEEGRERALAELELEFQQRRQKIREEFGGELPPDIENALNNLERQTREKLIESFEADDMTISEIKNRLSDGVAQSVEGVDEVLEQLNAKIRQAGDPRARRNLIALRNRFQELRDEMMSVNEETAEQLSIMEQAQQLAIESDLGVVEQFIGDANSIAQAEGLLQGLNQRLREATTDQAREQIRGLIDEVNNLLGSFSNVEREAFNVGQRLEQGLIGVVNAAAQAAGEGSSILGAITGQIGGFLQQFGQALTAYGIGMLNFQAALSNPFAAIGAGIALTVLGSRLRSLAQSGPGSFEGSAQGSEFQSGSGRSGGFSQSGGGRATIGAGSAGASTTGQSAIQNNVRSEVNLVVEDRSTTGITDFVKFTERQNQANVESRRLQ